MIIEYKDRDFLERYKLMSQSIIPRPIAWIVTENSKGLINIAPFSYFTGLSSNPPTIIVSIGHKKSGEAKDTLRNIRESGKATICMVTPEDLEPMHYSSKELDRDISEAELYNIETTKILDNFPPMVKNVPVVFFCKLHQEVELKGSNTIPIILEIEAQFIDDNIVDRDNMIIKYKPLARIGRSYSLLGDRLEAPTI